MSKYSWKHVLIESLQLYPRYEDKQGISLIETNQIITEEENGVLSCTLWDAKLVCSHAKIDTHRKIFFGKHTSFPRNTKRIR